ncbi:Conserved_hypothetical protein [Hexamita inflata]|uniref:Uncharacterized protein n=1 Tax=Hexamita inflata TaxID=28002 RepID=A0ABP1JS18_9EUKA
MKKRSISQDKFAETVKNQFNTVFKVQLDTNKDVVDFHQQLNENQRKQIRWDEIGDVLDIDGRQAYKYFVNTFSKAALDKWPQLLKENALQLCEQLFSRYYQPDKTEEDLRLDVIQEINNQMQLKEMKQYHYDTIYFSLRSRVHLLFCKHQNPQENFITDQIITQNNSSGYVKKENNQDKGKLISDLLSKVLKDK